MDPVYGDRYRRLYHEHWWWRARRRFVLKTLSRLRPDGGWGRILDVGCGDALFFDDLSELGRVEGVEVDAERVSADGPYRDRIHVQPFDGDFRPGHHYELILLLDVLEHLHDPVAALRHADRLLAPGGRVVLTVPAFPLLWSNHDVVNRHFVRYTRRTLRAVVESADLRVRESRYFFHWTWPVKLAIRLVEEVVRPDLRPPRMPPAWLNRALETVTHLEQRLVTPLRPPFGTSLLAVAGP